MTALDQWLADVGTAALVGTSRREPPVAPAALGVIGDETAPAEHRLLDGAALLDVLARGGAPLAAVDGPAATAPEETVAAASDQAAQLLHLLLTQPPVSRLTRDDLVVEWLVLADEAGARVPAWLLPGLLDHAAAHPPVARRLSGGLGVLGERGAWLLALNPDWSALLEADRSPAAGAGAADEWTAVWASLPTAQAIPAFTTGRRSDPAAARDLLDAEWETLTAKVRGEALQALRHGLSPDDEPLLERALDDKAKTVRETAAQVLGGLPTSALAGRMAARLRALVHVKGALSRHLEVDLPDAPEAAAIRDGLPAPTSTGQVTPTAQLARIVRAAPLATWTDITGRSIEATLKMVRDKDVLGWLVETVVERRDSAWAVACVAVGVPDPRLLWLLPREQRTRMLTSWVARPPAGRDLRALLSEAPRPWPDDLGRAVLATIQRTGGNPAVASAATTLLPAAISPSLSAEVRAALERTPEDATHVRRALTETLQLHAFRSSLTEAFR